MTQAGIILGTAAYMSPEQAAGKPVDKRSDLWAFGVVLVEMLTGRPVFAGETVSHVLASVLKDTPDFAALPPDTPPAIRKLLSRCLEKDRRKRLGDAMTARLEIDDALAAPVAGPPLEAHSVRRQSAPIAIGSAVVATLITAVAMWALTRSAPESRPLMRLDVALGGDAIEGERITVAISPDGRRIVFPIRAARGTRALATRLLDRSEVTPLRGTENGVDPVFSPDGEWIAFIADRELKKVPVSGGAPVTIATTEASVRGVSWGRDGSIVAALRPNSGLFVISDDGGAPKELTTLADGELTHRWPQYLPGSRAVLYTAAPQVIGFEDAAIQVVSLPSGAVKTLVRGGYFGRYMAGHLTWLHEGVMHAAPFDLDRLELQGTPIAALPDVRGVPDIGAGQFDAAANGTFVYRSGPAASAEYPVLRLTGDGRAVPLLSRPDRYLVPRLSPDGRRLAVAIDTPRGADLHVYDLQQQTLSRLTFDSGNNIWPVWSPDGRYVAYSSTALRTVLWLRADGGGEPHQLGGEKLPAGPQPLSFSHDGRYLALRALGRRSDLWMVTLDLNDPERPRAGAPEPIAASEASEVNAAFSPDGRWIAYVSDEAGQYDVYVRPLRAAAGGKWQVSTGGGDIPRWGPDGRTLYYLAPEGLIMAVDYKTGTDSFVVTTPRAWSPVPVRPPGFAGFPTLDLAPDGSGFVILPGEAQLGVVRRTFLLNFFDELKRRTAQP